jgi:hypothetical protein
MALIVNANSATNNNYVQFKTYQDYLVAISSSISTLVLFFVVFIAIVHVRKLTEKGMMAYLICLVFFSQLLYLCIGWTVTFSYIWV